jgi:hypothetical protein
MVAVVASSWRNVERYDIYAGYHATAGRVDNRLAFDR